MQLKGPDRQVRSFVIGLALVVVATGCSGSGDAKKEGGAETSEALVGLFRLDPGDCTTGGVTKGSYFRMVNPGGKPKDGPFVTNGDSTCKDKTWSALVAGTDGGLRTGGFQPHPEPAFDAAGNAASTAIVKPTKWFAVNFGLATNQKDPQTGVEVAAPTVSHTGNRITGDMRSLAAAWNKQHFNQGSPKPDGSKPGNTADLTGTYDPTTKRFVIEWVSQIVGGAFNNFSGVWHLEGTFEPT